MTKDLVRKISIPNTKFLIEEISVEEKKVLYEKFDTLGLPQSTAYRRFFDKGFDKWELMGIEQSCREFVELNKAYIHEFVEDGGDEGDRGYMLILVMNCLDDILKVKKEEAAGGCRTKPFLELMRRLHLSLAFKQYMQTLGMAMNTTLRRFEAEDWQQWEVQGVTHVLNGMM